MYWLHIYIYLILFPFNVKIGDKIKIDDHIIELGKKLGKYTITFV